ncbi:MAG: hypothetical protein ABIO79_11875 [Ferruginibacter sp.]
MKKILFAIPCCLLTILANAQLKIDNAIFFIQSGATVIVQGDVTSNADIQGTGLLLLKGSTLQNVDMGGFTIPNLELDNAANATLLNSDTRIGSSFVFTNGKFQTGNFNLRLSPTANITGAGTTRFVWTNGTGQLRKELTADIPAFLLPVGENANYRPAFLTTAGSAYSTASFGVRVLGTADPSKPPMSASFLNTSWPNTMTGITGGTVTLEGQYIDPSDVAGTEANLFGYYFNGTDWSSTGETHNVVTNRVSAPVTANTGSLSGINKFLAVGARAFLQGAYQAPILTAGFMNDNLRTLALGPASSTANFPQDDPYRQAPYATTFSHVNNAITESIPGSSVVATQPDPANNIVDWVFLQLRDLTASPGNVVLQTRSALIQRDGDIVDIDGVSPVTFNNLANGNYIITVRHRNHLGLSFDQATPKNFTETKSTAFTTKVADLKVATDAELFGNSTAFTSLTLPGPLTVKALWGGNSNISTATAAAGLKYVTPNSDNGTILSQVLSYPGNVSGLFNYSSATGYFSGDNNMNRIVKYITPNADGAIILANVLSLSSLFNYAGLVQQIPN